MELERILILVVLVLVPLANLLIQVWQKQRERKPPAPVAVPAPVPAKAKATPPARVTRRAARPHVVTMETPVPPPVARVAARTRTRKTLSLRRAVVSAEVLGPCRALRPFEPG